MTEALILFLSVIAGAVLGAGFFAGLWWTIRRFGSSPRPALWFLGSLVLRIGLVLLGFYLVSGGQWLRMMACLLGFLLARTAAQLLMMLNSRPSRKHPTMEAKNASQS